MKHRSDLRIGIVGAGPAGLTAAEMLREKGYTRITLLERSDQVGGKCCTMEHEERSYELGAGIVSDSSHLIRDLAQKFNVPMERVDFSSRLYLDLETGKSLRRSPGDLLKLCWQVGRYYRLARRYRAVARPGFSEVDADLCVPFSVFAKRHRIERLADEFAHYFTGFGYGFFDEVPAAYVLKYYPWDIVFAYIKRTFYKFPEGIQGLWKAIAKRHDVIYNANIRAIERSETVTVTTDAESFTFDALILTAPLDDALHYLDATDEERALFSKIRSYNYRTYACALENFPRVTGYVPRNLTSSRKGHPVFWYQRHTDSDLYTFYLFGDENLSDEVAHDRIRDLVGRLGGSLKQAIATRHWKFFPHIAPEDMQNGYFDRLEQLQGRHHTYYAGEVLNFSTVSHTAAYAKHLVDRFF